MVEEAKVVAELARVSLDDEASVEYVMSMLPVDEDGSGIGGDLDKEEEDEAVEALRGLVLEAADDDEDLAESVTQNIVVLWRQARAGENKKAASQAATANKVSLAGRQGRRWVGQ